MGSANYADHTCLMGNPLYSDEVGKMCFNPAKNHQIGWYDGSIGVVDPLVSSWTGKMVGVADFLNNPENLNVVMKIESGTSTDLYVGFNRATGINSQNDLCDNCVTIIQTGSNGLGYSQSWNVINPKGGMNTVGEKLSIGNFGGSGSDLIIEVLNIDLTSNPGTATVFIGLDGQQNCKPWCNEIPIPFKTNNPSDTQKCLFTGHCDQCVECA